MNKAWLSNDKNLVIQYWVIILIIFLWAFGLWSSHLSLPFVGRHDNNDAYWTIAGKNYLRFGYWEYGLGQSMDTDPSIETPEHFYNRHPPLTSLLASITITLFGEHELAARIIPMWLTLIGMAAWFRIVRDWFGAMIGLLALFFFATFPIIAFYGQMLNHEPLIISFVSLLLPVYIHYLRRPSRPVLLLIAIVIFFLTISGWQALFYVGIFGLHALIWRSKDFRLWLTIGLGAILAESVWFLPLILTFPDFLDNLYNQFLVRSGISESPWSSTWDYIWTIGWARWRPRYTEAALILSVIGGFSLIKTTLKSQSQKFRENITIIALLLVPPLLQMIVFAEQTYSHDYTLYYFSLPVALLCAIGVHTLFKAVKEQKGLFRYMISGLLLILILMYIATDIRWTYNIYTEIDWFPYEIAPYLQERTAPGTIIYTNAPVSPSLQYYSERRIQDGEISETDKKPFLDCQEKRPTSADYDVKAGKYYCTLR